MPAHLGAPTAVAGQAAGGMEGATVTGAHGGIMPVLGPAWGVFIMW